MQVDNQSKTKGVMAQELSGRFKSKSDFVKYFKECCRDFLIEVALSRGEKCERCWHYERDIGQYSDHPNLCGRCVSVLARR